jgi:hypothetical protein
MSITDPDERDETSSDGVPRRSSRRFSALAFEIIDTLKGEWRKVIVAVLGALIGLLTAQVFDGSDDAKTIGAILGAALGAWFQALAERFRWRTRTLNLLAIVLGVLGMPQTRAAITRYAAPRAHTGWASEAQTAGPIISAIAVVIAIGAYLTSVFDGPSRRLNTPEDAIAAYAISHDWEERGWTYSGDCTDSHRARRRSAVCSTPFPGGGPAFGARPNEQTYSMLTPAAHEPVTILFLKRDGDGWIVTRETG